MGCCELSPSPMKAEFLVCLDMALSRTEKSSLCSFGLRRSSNDVAFTTVFQGPPGKCEPVVRERSTTSCNQSLTSSIPTGSTSLASRW